MCWRWSGLLSFEITTVKVVRIRPPSWHASRSIILLTQVKTFAAPLIL